MKLIRVVIVLGVMMNVSGISRASGFDPLASIGKDKYMHFSAGVVISHASYPFFKRYVNEKHAWMYSFSLSVLTGIGKEIYDIPRTGFDMGDLAATALGGLTIVVVEF